MYPLMPLLKKKKSRKLFPNTIPQVGVGAFLFPQEQLQRGQNRSLILVS